MSIFREFNDMQRDVNRLMNTMGGGRRFGGIGGLGGFGGTSNIGDEDVWFNTPLLSSGFDMPTTVFPTVMPTLLPSLTSDVGLKNIDESKIAEREGGEVVPSTGATQLTTRPLRTIAARINIEDKENKYVVTADLPGFDKENVKLDIKDDVLILRAEQKKEHVQESKDKTYLRTERTFANVQRAISLPKNVDIDNISAQMINGVLHVDIPKSQKSIEKQQIQIA